MRVKVEMIGQPHSSPNNFYSDPNPAHPVAFCPSPGKHELLADPHPSLSDEC